MTGLPDENFSEKLVLKRGSEKGQTDFLKPEKAKRCLRSSR